MMKQILIIYVLILAIGCRDSKTIEEKAVKTELRNIIREKTLQVEEHYIDSTNIGTSKKYKIDFKKIRTTDSVYVQIQFYEKQQSKWGLKQNLEYPKDGILSCDPEFIDYNNDGLKDFTFISSIAARGANQIRKLFIFDSKRGILQEIKNAENFPNLSYNEELDCVDAFRVYGGSQSVFAKIESDTLREFANVELFDERIIITIIDRDGKQKIIRNEKYEEGTYKRFKNYNPLIEYGVEY